VADGTAAEVKRLASGRTIRATLPGADEAALRAMPGVDGVEVRGDTVLIIPATPTPTPSPGGC
jgi:ABC-2 type transport system ATP-binding protein